ncbi:MAG: glycosyl hydrolase [Gemmatimonadota bacterium]|nr:MAG: glycosyl hydrolase [Gemmatimonadota bacterium]
MDSTLLRGLEYRMVGPYRGGRSTAVAGIADRPHVFFMGTTGGGVWKTDDAGHNWHNLSDGFFGGSIGAVSVAASDPNVIYVGQGSVDIRGNTAMGRGIYRSVDGGKSWTFLGLGDAGQIGRIEIHPHDPDLVYVAALGHPFGKNPERGVYRSPDGGRTWEHVLSLNDSTGASDLAMNPRNPRELYAGMWRAERKPWTLISGGPEGGVYKTNDGGDTWKKLAGGLPDGLVGKVGVTVSAANPDRVWAIIQAEPDGGVYRSDDAGLTWKRVNAENKLRQRAFYYTHVVADPQDENTVYALNVLFYRSIDGGATFDSIPVPHGDIHDLWINPKDPTLMVVANDGGAQVTLNGGESWSTYMNQPTAELYDVIVDNSFPYRLYAGQQDNTTISVPAWSSSNSLHPKENWLNAGGCETGPVGLHPDYPERIYAGCYGGIIDRLDVSTGERRWVTLYPEERSGQAARELKYRFQWVAPIAVSPHDPDVVYHASQYVHRSANGGMSWETISPDLTTNTPEHQDYAGGPIDHDITGVEIFNTVFSIVVSPHSPDVIWAGSDDGRVHITTDAGVTWTDITPRGMPARGTVDEIEVSPHQAGRAFLAVHRYREGDLAPYIFATDDFGGSWRLLTDGRNGIPADYPVRTVREDPDHRDLLYAGTELGIFVSFDGGRNWGSLQSNLPITPITGLRVAHKDLIVATQGRSFWILDDITPLHQLGNEVLSLPAYLFTPRPAYRVNARGVEAEGEPVPQPAPGNALIHFYLASEPTDEVRLEVLDTEGALVRAFSSDSAVAAREGGKPLEPHVGLNRVVWDLTYPGPDTLGGVVIAGFAGGVKAPPGTYQIRLTLGEMQETRLFSVLSDPRIADVSQFEFDEQFRLSVAVRDTISRLYDAIRNIRAARDQLVNISSRGESAGYPPEVVAAADSIVRRLTEVEGELRQTRSESEQDPLRFPPKLDTQLLTLYGFVTGVDNYSYGGPEGKPTEGAYERFEDLSARWREVSAQLRLILETDVAALNARIQGAGVPAIIVPSRSE